MFIIGVLACPVFPQAPKFRDETRRVNGRGIPTSFQHSTWIFSSKDRSLSFNETSF
jgi:hypothetical protein